MDARDLFISHASEDDAVARELRAALEAAGYTCWMAPDDVVGSRPWAEQILTAINATRIMVVLISKHANESVHVSREVNLALGHARAILPVRIEAVAPGGALEYLLTLVQRADAFPLPVDGHMPRIRRMVDALLESAPPATPEPATDAAPRPDPDAVAEVPVRVPVTAPGPRPGALPTTGGSGPRVWVRGHVALLAAAAGLAVVAVVAAALLLGPKPSPGPSPSTAIVSPSAAVPSATPVPVAPPAPTGLTAHAVLPTEVDLTWSAPGPGAVVTGYRVLREKAVVRTLAADAVAYRDLGTAPETTYNYSVVAIGPGGESGAARAAATTGPIPASIEGRFEGEWKVSALVKASSLRALSVGTQTSDTWTITPVCVSGTCDVTATNKLQLGAGVRLTRSDTDYSGSTTWTGTDPTCGAVHETVEVTFVPSAAGYDITGHYAVRRVTGSVTDTVTPDGLTCKAGSATYQLIGVAVVPGLIGDRGIVSAALGCVSPAADPDTTHFKSAVATAGCSVGTENVTFYQFLSASEAESAFRSFFGTASGGEDKCIATPPGAGSGPWGRTGATENAGDVACGPPTDPDGTWIYVWTDWQHSLLGYARWKDPAALRTFWATPGTWLAN